MADVGDDELVVSFSILGQHNGDINVKPGDIAKETNISAYGNGRVTVEIKYDDPARNKNLDLNYYELTLLEMVTLTLREIVNGRRDFGNKNPGASGTTDTGGTSSLGGEPAAG